MQTRWVTFDCYGTLVDWQAGFLKILRPIAKQRTVELLDAYHRHEPQVEAERPLRSYKEVLSTALKRAAKEIGFRLDEEQALCLGHQWSALPVFEDVEPALAALRTAQFKLGVLTNCDEDLFAQTQRKFRRPFDLVITAQTARDYKPALSHFHCFERRSDLRRAQWVHVGCSWFHDMVPARKLGIKSIWLDRLASGAESHPVSRLRSARDLPKTILQMFANL